MTVELNRREKMIAVVTLVLVALFVSDRLVIEPALAYREQLRAEAERQAEARELGERLYAGLGSLEDRWSQLRASGLADSAGDAESRLLQAVRAWANEAGVSVTSMLPDRVEPDGRLPRVHVRVAGAGSMGQVVALLVRLETADLPVRVEEVQLATRRDGGDEGERALTLQVRLSTLYVSNQPIDNPRERRPRP